MNRTFRRLAAVGALLLASTAQAGLLGQGVTGSLLFPPLLDNYFDPASGFVPTGFLNEAGTTVIVSGSDVEFGFDDTFNAISADFSDDQLVIQQDIGPDAGPFTMSFTSSMPGIFLSLDLVGDSFDPRLSFSLSGDTLTIDWAGEVQGPANFRAVFDITTPTVAVPEPGSLALAGLAFGLAGLALRRRA